MSTYKISKDVHDIWIRIHQRKIYLAADRLLLDIDFGLSQSAFFLQELEVQSSQQSNAGSVPMLSEDDSQSSLVALQDITPDITFTCCSLHSR